MRNTVVLSIACLFTTGTTRPQPLQAQSTAAELERRGDLRGAENELRNALEVARAAGTHSVDFARALAAIGVFYHNTGRFSQAESSFVTSLKIFRGITTEDDLALAPLIIHLAWLYVETGRAGPANRLRPGLWVDRLTRSDPQSKYLPLLLELVGGLYAIQGKFANAEDMYKRDFDLLAKRGADGSAEMASALNNLGFIELRAGRHREAAKNFSEALQLWMQLSGHDDLQVAIAQLGLAKTYLAVRRYDDSLQLLQQALPIFEKRCGPNSLRTEDVVTHYARVLRRQKRPAEAKAFEARARLIRSASATDASFGQVIDIKDLGENDAAPKNSPNRVPKEDTGLMSQRRGFFAVN